MEKLPVGKPYEGSIELGVDYHDERMEVHLYTERLHLQSIEKDDVEDYQVLFADSNVMGTYALGNPVPHERTAVRVQTSWIPRWEKGYPFSALAIRDRETNAFIGHIVAGDGDDMGFDASIGESGYSEMAYLLHQRYWRQGYGKEATAAVVKKYVPSLTERKVEVMTGVGEGKEKSLPLKWLTATSRIDQDSHGDLINPASVKILTGLGFTCKSEGEKFGHRRGYFGLQV